MTPPSFNVQSFSPIFVIGLQNLVDFSFLSLHLIRWTLMNIIDNENPFFMDFCSKNYIFGNIPTSKRERKRRLPKAFMIGLMSIKYKKKLYIEAVTL